MGKSPWDLAAFLDCVTETNSTDSHIAAVQDGAMKGMSDFRVGVVRGGHSCTEGIDPSNTARVAESQALYNRSLAQLQPAIDPVECPAVDKLVDVVFVELDDKGNMTTGSPDDILTLADFSEGVTSYLGGLGETDIKTFDDLLQWQNDHPVSLESVSTH